MMTAEPLPAGPIHVQFRYTPADLREARRTRWQDGKPRRMWAAVVGWAVVTALAVVMFTLVNGHQRQANSVPVSPDPPLVRLIVIALPWVVVVLFLSVVVYVQTQRARKDPLCQRLIGMSLTDVGVTTIDAAIRTEYGWDALDLLAETNRLFLARLTNNKQSWVVSPKRALPNEQAVFAVRNLFNAHVRPAISAFPVLPA